MSIKNSSRSSVFCELYIKYELGSSKTVADWKNAFVDMRLRVSSNCFLNYIINNFFFHRP